MEVKPGYKQTALGMIPEDWEVSLLDSVATRGSGHTPDKAHPEYWNGQIKWISLQDSDRLDRLYIYDTAAKVTPLGIANSSAKMHPEGTVVLSRDAGVGKIAIMMDDMAVSQHFIAWQCGPLLNNHFLYYWLQTNKSEFQRIAMGSTIKTIGLLYFKQLVIPRPSKAEQEVIAEALGDADALIQSLEQLLVKKRQLKRGATQELLSGRRRLPDFGAEHRRKKTEIGVIPEDWTVRRLGDGINLLSGHHVLAQDCNTDGRGMAYITGPADFPNGVIQHTKHTTRPGTICEAKDILVTVKGSGAGTLILSDAAYCISRQLMAIQVLTWSALFVYYFLLRDALLFGAAAAGLIPGLSRRDILDKKIAVPPTRNEQESIAAVLSEMDAEIVALELKLAKARQLKQGMMQELLTGRTRLI